MALTLVGMIKGSGVFEVVTNTLDCYIEQKTPLREDATNVIVDCCYLKVFWLHAVVDDYSCFY